MGCFIPSIFFDDSDINDPELSKVHLFNMNIVLAILCTLVLIPSVIFMTNNDVTEKNAVVKKRNRSGST